MRLRLNRPPLAALLVIVGVIIADQVTKAIVVANANRLPATVFGPVKLEIIHNTGVSFSLFPGKTGLMIALVSLIVVVVTVLLFVLPRYFAIPVSLILAGSIGNLIDRVRWGYVVDYVGVWWWPRFNVADFAIVLGAVLVVLVALLHTVNAPPSSSSAQEGTGGGSRAQEQGENPASGEALPDCEDQRTEGPGPEAGNRPDAPRSG